MGRSEWPERVVQIIAALVALFAFASGAVMLADPFGWYQLVDTVKFTGPPNRHFISDIGLAYVATALVLGFGAINPPMRWLALVGGNLWLTLHAGLHIVEYWRGICSPGVFWRDAPAVIGLPLLVWLALAILFARHRVSPAGVPKAAFLAMSDRMAPDESAYLHEIAGAPGDLFERFKHFMPLTMHRRAASSEMFHVARIAATLAEGCGPCALTAARWALEQGVSRDLVNAALAGAPPEGELKTAFDFGHAVASQADNAVALGDVIEQRAGRDVRRELAVTAATVRSYPAIKRGLGLTKACSATALRV